MKATTKKAIYLLKKLGRETSVFNITTTRAYDKECVLILIDEILNSMNPFCKLLQKKYWEEVKQELRKL
jgi:hypothetical protein